MKLAPSPVALLPQEILASITSFLVAPDVLRLCLTGDSLLLQKLHQGGVRRFTTSTAPLDPLLRHTGEIKPPRWAIFHERRFLHGSLSRFTQLSHISICYNDLGHSLPAPSSDQLSFFSKTLLSLEVRMPDAYRVLLTPELRKMPFNSSIASYHTGRGIVQPILQHLLAEDRSRLGHLNFDTSSYPFTKMTNPWLNLAEMMPNLQSFVVVSTSPRLYSAAVEWKDSASYAALLITSLPRSLQEFESNLVAGYVSEVFHALRGSVPDNPTDSSLNNQSHLPYLDTLIFHGNTSSMFTVSPHSSDMDRFQASLLPISITSLRLPTTLSAEAVKALPNLRTLRVQLSYLEVIRALSPYIEHLETGIALQDHGSTPNYLSLFPRSLKTLRLSYCERTPVDKLSELPPGLTNLALYDVGISSSGRSFASVLTAHLPSGLRILEFQQMPFNCFVPINSFPANIELLAMPYIERFTFANYTKFPSLTGLACRHSVITEEAIIYAPPRMKRLIFAKAEAQGIAITRQKPSELATVMTRDSLMKSLSSWLETHNKLNTGIEIFFESVAAHELLECPSWITSIDKSIDCSKIRPSRLPPFLTSLTAPYRLEFDEIQQLPPLLSRLKDVTVILSLAQALRITSFIPPDANCYVHPRTLSQTFHLLPEYQVETSSKEPLLLSPLCEAPLTTQLLSSLPSNLQKLAFVQENVLTHDLFRAFPRTVTDLSIKGTADALILLDIFAFDELQNLVLLSMGTPIRIELHGAEQMMFPRRGLWLNVAQSALGFGVLPRGLTSLTMGTHSDSFINLPAEAWGDLPQGLKQLHFNVPSGFSDEMAINLPRSITDLRINTNKLSIKCFDNLPPNLQLINLGRTNSVAPFKQRMAKRMEATKPNLR